MNAELPGTGVKEIDPKAIDLSNLDKNYFELFAVPESFSVDVALLRERYQDLQKLAHPDRFAHADDQQQLQSVQFSAYLNEALETLKTPIKRAAYLLELQGLTLAQEGTAPLPPEFLLHQMELRESLEEAEDLDALDELRDRAEADWRQLVAAFQQCLADNLLSEAETEYRKMQFINKLLREIELREDDLDD